MEISTKLFNQKAVKQFSEMNEDIQNLQNRVATGKNILRASDDPVAAVNLSVSKEQRALVERFEKNAASARQTLHLTDGALQQAINVVTRISELAIQAGNDTYGVQDRKAIEAEVDELTNVLVSIANTRDSSGQSIFGGYKTDIDAFKTSLDGTITYQGDTGQRSLQLSENMPVTTSLDGANAFMRVETTEGSLSIFDMLKSAKSAISSAASAHKQATATGSALVEFTLPRDPIGWKFSITGSKGTAEISADISTGNISTLSAAINAQTSATGVAANVDANGALQLTENFNGEIKMSHVEINGVDFAEQEVEYFANFTSYDGAGEVVGEIRKLTDMDQIISTSVNNLSSTISHISSQMAFVGAQINKVDTQTQVLSERKITVDEKISEIGDADLTELVTQLKSLILNRDAAQQAFVKIGQQSLFDYLR